MRYPHSERYLPSWYNRVSKSVHSGIKQKPKKAIRKVGKQKAKRQARNRAYYASAEWKAKKTAVHERDGFQCTEVFRFRSVLVFQGEETDFGMRDVRCQNRGEIVNHKQTSRGLVCEEVSYGHRGVPDYIDTCKTRCKDCDRRLTPLERINHAHGFQQQHVAASSST